MRYGGSDSIIPGQLFNTNRFLNLSNVVSTSSKLAAVYGHNTSSTTLSNVTLGNSQTGLYLANLAGANIVNSTFINNETWGIKADQGFKVVTVATSTFTNNANAAAYFTYGGANSTISNWGNTAGGTGLRGFAVYGTISGNETWYSDGLPFIASSTGISIANPKALTIKPGVILKFATTTSALVINSGGTLNALGDEFLGAVWFTSLRDDKRWDTNGDGGLTTPAGGDWKHLSVSAASAVANLNYAIVRYGGNGSGSYANLYNNGGTLKIASSTIATSSYYGIYNNSGNVEATSTDLAFNPGVGFYVNGGTAKIIASSTIHGNGYYGVWNNTTATSSAVAENDYWGKDTGPYHPWYNSGGTGDSVGNYVDFDPWKTVLHFVQDFWAVDTTEFFGSKEIRWGGSTTYSNAWDAATSTWNALGAVNIAPDDIWHWEDLTLSDVTLSDVVWAGQYDPNGNDSLKFNTFWMDSFTDGMKQNVVIHELGHALGLGHSYLGNTMYLEVSPSNVTTTLGNQDITDYNYCWVDQEHC